MADEEPLLAGTGNVTPTPQSRGPASLGSTARSRFGYNDLRRREASTTVWYDELNIPDNEEDEGETVHTPLTEVSTGKTPLKPGSPSSTVSSNTGRQFDQLRTHAEAEAELTMAGLRRRHHRRELEDAFTPHVFSAEERKRMDAYESIDYYEPRNMIYAEYLVSTARKKHTRYLKWVVFMVIGIAVGLWACVLFETIDWLAEKKLSAMTSVMEVGPHISNAVKHSTSGSTSGSNSSSASGSGSGTSSLPEMFPFESLVGSAINGSSSGSQNNHSHVTGDLAPIMSLVKGFFLYMGWSILAVFLSSLCCVFMPTAAGSGIPDVMAYLNGIMWPRVFNIRTLFVKTISCILAVNSGLPVGGEGPIIHIGALIGAGLPSGRSRTLGRLASTDHSFLAQFRNAKDHREFISGGAAAGVTGAFGAPIGGLFFVMEEIATHFPAKLGWMVFVSCLSCVTVMDFFNSFIDGWQLRDRSGMGFGDFSDAATVLFETQGAPGVVPMNVFSLVPSVVLGIVFGLVAVGFTLMNIRVARWRARVVNKTTRRRVIEPVVVMACYGLLSYIIPLAFGCEKVPDELVRQELQEIRLVRSFCANPAEEFHPMASVTLTSSYNVIRLLYTRKTGTIIPWPALLVYQVLYTLGASYSGGMFMSSGMVIPTMVIGAIGGRLMGQLVGETWCDAGLAALVGSSAFFGGLARLTYSVVVIMLEVSNDLSHIVIIMVAVLIGRTVANKFCHSLYHQQLEVKCAPFLDDSTQMLHNLDANCAGDVMASPVEIIKTTEKVCELVDLLKRCKHNAFPVVSIKDGKTYRGLALRSTVEELLWHLQLLYVKANESGKGNEAVAAVSHPTYEDIQTVREYQFWERCLGVTPEGLPSSITELAIDMNPYIDQSAHYVHESVCVSRTFNLFRQLGLRHLTVLNRHNSVVGIITRKNLIGDRLNDTIMARYTATHSQRCEEEEEEGKSKSPPPPPPPPGKPSSSSQVETSGKKSNSYGGTSPVRK